MLEKFSVQNFTKILHLGAEFFYEEVRKDKLEDNYHESNNAFSLLCEPA